MTRNKRRLIFGIGIIALGILSAELTLRFIGTVVLSRSEVRMGPEHENQIRILALGESTTDLLPGNQYAWPELLEKKLKAQNLQVKVFNLGKAGTISSLIVSRIRQDIENYRPHIVISMMGINDSGILKFDYAQTDWKLLRFFYLLLERVESKLSCSLHQKELSSDRHLGQWAEIGNKDIDKLVAHLKQNNLSNEDTATALTLTGIFIQGRTFPYDSSKVLPFFDRAFEIDPLNELNVKNYLWALSNGKDPSCLKVVSVIKDCGINLPDSILASLSSCIRNHNPQVSLSAFSRRGLSVIYSDDTILEKNYNFLAKFLREKGIPLLAMQYPTLPVKSLQDIFQDASFRPVSFIDNTKNFSEALKTKKFEDIFQDNFRGSWGHTTSAGHDLIAEEALKAVLPVIRKSVSTPLQIVQP